jgi:molecular chaperone GrpE (heat shock protein)
MDNIFRYTDGQVSNENHPSDTSNQCGNADSSYDQEVMTQQQEGNTPRPLDVEFIAKYLGQVVEQTISKLVLIPQAKKGNGSFEQETITYLKQLLNGITVTDRYTNQKEYVTPKILRNQDITTKNLNSITQELQALRQLVEGQVKIIEEQAAIIKNQHENIIRYENDVIYKTQKDLIMELIGIADQLRYTLNDFAQQNDFVSLYKTIGDLAKWVDGSLQTVAVRKCVSADSKELDRKRQEIVEIRETDNPDEDGKIESLLPGYIWSVPMVGSMEMHSECDRPKSYEFMIRPEQVLCLKYVKVEADSSNGGEIELSKNAETTERIIDEENAPKKRNDSIWRRTNK